MTSTTTPTTPRLGFFTRVLDETSADQRYQLALEQIKPGSSAEQVILVMGTPSTVSTVGGKAYYYISQQVSQRFQFMPKHITDQRVLAVDLDKNNKVERLANYGIKDGKVFDFISEKTPTGGAENSLLAQIMHAAGAS